MGSSSLVPTISMLFETLLVIVMGAAGSVKLMTLRGFRSTLGVIPWVPVWLVGPLAVGLPIAELSVALLLFSPWPRVALGSTLVLVVAMAITAVWAVRNRYRVQCRCFGPLWSSELGTKTLLRLAGLGTSAVVPLIAGRAVPLATLDAMALGRAAGTVLTLWLVAALFGATYSELRLKLPIRRRG